MILTYTKEFLSNKYEELYNKASEILKKYNPCQIENDNCISGRKSIERKDIYGSFKFCCQGCKHLSPNGCTVKALYCKTWICNYLQQNGFGWGSEFAKEMREVIAEADRYDLLKFRSSKEESLARNNYLVETDSLKLDVF